MDYETFIANLVKPLVLKPEEVTVEQFSDDEDLITIQVKVDSADLGRVIGKKGRIADSIRTLAYACAAREGKRIAVSFEEL
ncbi:MAG: KH domain-containing protein [Bacilli bacterium]|nr:KH domain-containing protein [Bacilli bacterium]